MFVHRSNRSEQLVDALARVVRHPLDALAPELIIVHSKGMERWLAMQLSQRLGVFANAEFPFPRHLVERLFDLVLGDAPELAAPFDPHVTMWSIAALLPQQLADPAFEPIARYLAEDGDGSLLLQLAQRIARVFDDYAVYRPELLLQWEAGAEGGWDARLFRALCARHGRGHQPARARRFMQALAGGRFERAGLPQRVCLFGMSSLPPLYVSVLSALAEHVETHLFVLSPSREYFADIAKRPAASGDDASVAHPLLASLGRLGREFQALLEERTQYVESDADAYVDPGQDCLLHMLQSDMLSLRQRGTGPGQFAPAPLAETDESVRIHVCHSRIRELEALHDRLVALLEDPELEPHDIVVMAPDIEAYAPGIDAVFGARTGRPELPYSVADRKTRTTHPVVDALHALLATLSGRLSASAVLDLLSLDCIRRRFGIEAEDMDQLRAWIEESGIRWGADEEHRAEVGQPAFPQNTWRHGLHRMLLGYAMQPQGQRLFSELLPFEAVEGGAAQLLGKLVEVCERMFQHRRALAVARPLPAWRDALLALLADLIDATGANAYEHQLIRAALDRLVQAAELAGFEAPIELRSLEAQLERALDEGLPARGLLARGISFCQLVPMRGIPFKVVCLIGMDDDAFPGRSPSLGFDRMSDAATRALGDRNRRDDDRYLFLEALLCARERLIVSYIGRGVRDNRVLPPSVMVGELLDAIERSVRLPGVAPSPGSEQQRGALERRLCVVHRLHAFSPRYFEAGHDSALFSYSELACQAARALGSQRSDPPLLRGALPARSAVTELSIDELIAWMTVPVRTFLQQRLGLYLGNELAALPSREPLDLEGLDRWQLGTDLLTLALRGFDLREMLAVARGGGQLPLGTVGAVAYEDLWPEVQALARAAGRHRGGAALDPLAIELELDGVRLTGSLHGLWPKAHVCVSFSRFGKRFELAHFIRHVVLNCCLQQSEQLAARYPRSSVIVARGGADGDRVHEVHFGAIEQPERLLGDWIALVQAAQSRPLPFVHDLSRNYCESLQKDAGAGPEVARRVAERQFDEPTGPVDAYVRAAFRDFASLWREHDELGFATLAQRVLEPMLSARRLLEVRTPAQQPEYAP